MAKGLGQVREAAFAPVGWAYRAAVKTSGEVSLVHGVIVMSEMTYKSKDIHLTMRTRYHATKRLRSIERRVHLELTMIKSHHSHWSLECRHGQFNDLSILECEKEKKAE